MGYNGIFTSTKRLLFNDFRKFFYSLARKIYRYLPLPLSIKIRIRNLFRPILHGQFFNSYNKWIKSYDTLTNVDHNGIQEHIATFEKYPLLSVVLPVYNTSEKFLRKSIESVVNQIYPHWELFIQDTISSQPNISRILKEYADKDVRIKICSLEEKYSLSRAFNSALYLSTGEFITLLDANDEMSDHALYWMATELIRFPETKIIYSDEDKIDLIGERFDPYFKTDWNPELLMGQNFIGRLAMYFREQTLDLGGFREGYEGAEDWDLALRLTEGLPPHRVRHIPAILYHRRISQKATPIPFEKKPIECEAQYRTLTDTFHRRGEEVRITSICNKKFWLPEFNVRGEPLISIIIPTRNGMNLLKRCLESLKRTKYPHTEVLVIDNQSDDPKIIDYLEEIKERPNHRVLSYPHSFDYAAMHNWAVPQAIGEYICLLNNDTEVITPEWLQEMLAIAQRSGVGAVGAKLLYPDGSVQHGGIILGINGIAGHAHKGIPGKSCGYFGLAVLLQSYSAVTAACMLIKKTDWQSCGGMEPKLPVSLNDIDLCLRLKEKGLRNILSPRTLLFHHESKSRGFDTHGEDLSRLAGECAYMQWRWGYVLTHDPSYNPNLTLLSENFALAWPPRVRFPWRPEPLLVDVPFGLSSNTPELLLLNPDKEMRGSFPLPLGLSGNLVGISLLAEKCLDRSGGTFSFRLEDVQNNLVTGSVQLSEPFDNSFIFLNFSCEKIPLHGQKRLQFLFCLSNTTYPVRLYSYPLSEEWGHKISGHDNNALRIVLHIIKEK